MTLYIFDTVPICDVPLDVEITSETEIEHRAHYIGPFADAEAARAWVAEHGNAKLGIHWHMHDIGAQWTLEDGWLVMLDDEDEEVQRIPFPVYSPEWAAQKLPPPY